MDEHAGRFAPTRQHEVFLRNPRAWDDEWLPLVEATDSPLLYLVHDGMPHGSVAHVNEDGTFLMTDNEAGNTRAKRQAEQGFYGWPPAGALSVSIQHKDGGEGFARVELPSATDRFDLLLEAGRFCLGRAWCPE